MKLILTVRQFAFIAIGLIISVNDFLLFSRMAYADDAQLFSITGSTLQDGVGIISDSVTADAPGTSNVLYSFTNNGYYDNRFALSMPAGTYDIHLNPPANSGLSPVIYNDYTVSGDQNIGGVSYTAANPGQRTFSGKFTDNFGNPIPKLALSLRTDDHIERGSATTASDGTFKYHCACKALYSVLV